LLIPRLICLKTLFLTSGKFIFRIAGRRSTSRKLYLEPTAGIYIKIGLNSSFREVFSRQLRKS
jgi:hypothetical protein